MARKPRSLATQYLVYYMKIYLVMLFFFGFFANVGEGPHRTIMRQLASLRLERNWLQVKAEGDPTRLTREELAHRLRRDLNPRESASLQILSDSQEGPAGHLGVRLDPLAARVWVDIRLSPLATYARMASPFRLSAMLLCVLAVPFLAAWLTSRRVTQPLLELQEASMDLADGDLSSRVPIADSWELGQLAQSFNAMAQQLEERDQRLLEQNQKLQELNLLKSQFLANVSHELRTPLTAILGQSQVLLDGIKGPLQPPQMAVLDKLQRNAEVLIQLINDLLDMSRIEAGRLEVQREEFCLQDCAQEAICAIEPQLQAKGLELRFQSSPDLDVLGDYLRTRQILVNLLANAVKFTERGTVGVRFRHRGEFAEVEVSDTGIGILEKDLSLIFDEFRQLEGTSSRQMGGSGLGLAIALKLARLQDGQLKVRSEPGSGSYFTLSLPMAVGE